MFLQKLLVAKPRFSVTPDVSQGTRLYLRTLKYALFFTIQRKIRQPREVSSLRENLLESFVHTQPQVLSVTRKQERQTSGGIPVCGSGTGANYDLCRRTDGIMW